MQKMKELIFTFLITLTLKVFAEKLDLFYGFSQDTPSLIRHIQNLLIPPETSKQYNFTRKFKNEDRSQFGQDEAIMKILNYKKNGIFIEAGAYDGEVHSNTLQLELKYNWTGLLIEPNPDSFQSLLTKHRKCHAINACLSTSNKVKEEYFDAAGETFLASFHDQLVNDEVNLFQGLFGGIINGKFLPGDANDIGLKERKLSDPGYQRPYAYERRQFHMICLPLTSIIKARIS